MAWVDSLKSIPVKFGLKSNFLTHLTLHDLSWLQKLELHSNPTRQVKKSYPSWVKNLSQKHGPLIPCEWANAQSHPCFISSNCPVKRGKKGFVVSLSFPLPFARAPRNFRIASYPSCILCRVRQCNWGWHFFPSKVAFLSSPWTKLAEICYTFNLTSSHKSPKIVAKSVHRRPIWHNFWSKKTATSITLLDSDSVFCLSWSSSPAPI